MITVYFRIEDLPDEKKLVEFNDAWFNKYYYDMEITDAAVDIIKKIDGVEYAGSHRVKSKYEDNVNIRMAELSTGCKTALNILFFPDEIFSVAECGENAFNEIIKFNDGHIFMTYFVLPADFFNNVGIVYQGKTMVIKNKREFVDVMEEVFA